jgi:hypothetical protein
MAVIVAFTLLISSCLGIDSRIKISSNGSGTVVAEYRLSQELVAFGELEANRSMLPVPLSRTDLEDSLKGAKGLSLKSWNSSTSGTDLLLKVAIDFDSLASLMYYLDPRGELARHEILSDGKNRIQFSLGDKMPPLDPDMKTIATQSFLPYSFKFSVETPTPPVLARADHQSITARIEGKTAHFEGKMSDIVSTEVAPKMELSW